MAKGFEAMHTNDSPTIGLIVHYWNGTKCRAAIITDLELNTPDTVVLEIFEGGGGNAAPADVAYDASDERAEGTWHYTDQD